MVGSGLRNSCASAPASRLTIVRRATLSRNSGSLECCSIGNCVDTARSCGAPTVSGPLSSGSVLASAGYCTMIEAERKSEYLAICRDLCQDADVFLAASWATAVGVEREVAYDKADTHSPYACSP